MKYIKEYKVVTSLEKLADCLQEILDKYNIPYMDCDFNRWGSPTYTRNINNVPSVVEGKLFWSYRQGRDIFIGPFDVHRGDERIKMDRIKSDIYSDIRRQRSTIENRMSSKIEIGSYRGCISIQLEF